MYSYEALNKKPKNFYGKVYQFVTYLLDKPQDERHVRSSSTDEKQTKMFYFYNNITKLETFTKIPHPPVDNVTIEGHTIVLINKSAKEMVEEIVAAIVPKETSRNIGVAMKDVKDREKPNDVFITSLKLAKLHIDMIETKEADVWLDPCRGTGNYFNQFPTKHKRWCEITDERDFLTYRGKDIDVIVGNPPYSLLDQFFEKAVKLKPRVISFLIGVMNFTGKRFDMLKEAGYKLRKIQYCKVAAFVGTTTIFVWIKNETRDTIVTWDNRKWESDDVYKQKKLKRLEREKKKLNKRK